MFPSFYFQSGRKLLLVFLENYHSINDSFDAVGLSVEFLLSRDELLIGNTMVILAGSEHNLKPLGDISDSSFAVTLHIFNLFLERI
jgi:hypothetical protein